MLLMLSISKVTKLILQPTFEKSLKSRAATTQKVKLFALL